MNHSHMSNSFGSMPLSSGSALKECAVEKVKVSQLLMDGLFCNTNNLLDALSSLEARLHPVLAEDYPCCEDQKKAINGYPPLFNDLETINDRIVNAIKRTHNIYDRACEL